MFRARDDRRDQMALVLIGDLVPDDHLLRAVDRVLDLSWVAARVAPLYHPRRGAPTIPPEAVLRLLLAGFLVGEPGLRPLLRRAETDVAMRWFAGYGLTDRLPDHSSLSKILKRWGPELFAELFQQTVSQCVSAGLVGGEAVHVDATLIRADVSMKSLTRRYVAEVCGEEGEEEGGSDDGPPPPVRFAERGEEVAREAKKRSRTDPDATLTTNQKNERMEPRYKAHVAADSETGVIVEVAVTTGETSESGMLLEQLARVEERTGVRAGVVTADGGYGSGGNYAGLEGRGQEAVIPPPPANRGPKRRDGTIGTVPLRRFRYDERHDVVRCPRGERLEPGSRDEEGRWYRASAQACRGCPLRSGCVPPSAKARSVRLVDGYPALVRSRRAKERGWDEEREAWYARHRACIEGRHAEAKRRHGLGRAIFRGLGKVRVQVLLTMAVLNLKILARAAASWRDGGGGRWWRRMVAFWGACRWWLRPFQRLVAKAA